MNEKRYKHVETITIHFRLQITRQNLLNETSNSNLWTGSRHCVILYVWFRPTASACKLHRVARSVRVCSSELARACGRAACIRASLFSRPPHPYPTGKDTHLALAGIPDDGVSPISQFPTHNLHSSFQLPGHL